MSRSARYPWSLAASAPFVFLGGLFDGRELYLISLAEVFPKFGVLFLKLLQNFLVDCELCFGALLGVGAARNRRRKLLVRLARADEDTLR